MASNDFFSSENLRSAAALPNNNRRAPPPPPRRTTKKASRTRQTRETAQSDTMATRNSASSRTINNHSSISGSRKTTIASRPVGSYYNSSSNSSRTSAYASPVAAATAGTNTTENDSWGDWSTDNDSTTKAASNDHSSWAASGNNPASTASNSGWYSTGGSTASAGSTGADQNMYTNSGSGSTTAASNSIFPSFAEPAKESQQQAMEPGNGFYQRSGFSQEQQQQTLLSGAMDSSAPTMTTMNTDNNNANSGLNAMPSFSIFTPSSPMQQDGGIYHSPENEAPLLEEIGINVQHILLKSKAVVLPFSRFGGDQIDPAAICQDGDLPGPIALSLLLGGEMVLTGKLQFGYIYVYGLFGCIAMTFVVNLISPTDAVSFWTVTSIMGYSLLPVNILALIKIVIMNIIHLQTLGFILGGLTVLWSTVASTRLLELGCGLRYQRYLIAYPLLLFYSAFVMMTIL